MRNAMEGSKVGRVENPDSQCRLCGASDILIDSHLIPKGVYRRVQNSFCGFKKDLVQTDLDRGTAALDSRQLKEKLLCKSCESRFKVSEDYFYQIIDSEDRRWISTASRLSSEVLSGQKLLPIDLRDAEIDISKITYFILSILWRCSVSSRRELESYHNSLGMVFSEEIEEYLLEKGPFPEKCWVRLTVYDNVHASALISVPKSGKQRFGGNQIHSHIIHLLGITFEVFRGGPEGLFPRDSQLPCYGRFSCQQEDFEKSSLFRHLASEMRNTTKNGKLNKLYSLSDSQP